MQKCQNAGTPRHWNEQRYGQVHVMRDVLNRPLRNLRLSVTDRCNLRCHYCMPEDEYVWLPREDVLSFDEIARLADLVAEHGVDRLRLTGGEPLLRRNLPDLIRLLPSPPWLHHLPFTPNAL